MKQHGSVIGAVVANCLLAEAAPIARHKTTSLSCTLRRTSRGAFVLVVNELNNPFHEATKLPLKSWSRRFRVLDRDTLCRRINYALTAWSRELAVLAVER